MEDNDSVEEELNALYSEIESEFGKAPDEPDEIEEAARRILIKWIPVSLNWKALLIS